MLTRLNNSLPMTHSIQKLVLGGRKLRLNEVTMRDGFQGIKSPIISVKDKLKLLSKLCNTGYSYIEIGSFVSSKTVPQMANTLDLIKNLDTLERRVEPNTFGVLVLNHSGLQKVIDNQELFKRHNITVALVTSPSEHFCLHNMKMNSYIATKFVTDSMKTLTKMGLCNRVYISTCFSDQVNWITPDAVARVVDTVYLSSNEIVLSDTFATATEDSVRALLKTVTNGYDKDHFTMHFHESDDKMSAIRNVQTALHCGVISFDGTISDSLGGCVSFDKTHRNLDLINLMQKGVSSCTFSYDTYRNMRESRNKLHSILRIHDRIYDVE